MASDTATLDLERVHAARRRLEAERDGQVALGPDDQPAVDDVDLDIDPATRAARIVQEVLTAAGAEAVDDDEDDLLPPAGDGPAAARARRIVEEVLAAAADATDAQSVDADGTDDPAPLEVRADLVLLAGPEPLVLLPGEAYEPEPAGYVPRAEPRRLGALVDRALESLRLDPAAAPATDRATVPAAAPDELATPQSVREAIRGAGESSNRHGVRWVVAGAVWALAFALAGPLAYKALVSSADMTIDLWSDAEQEAVERSVDVPEEELPPARDGSDPAEAELTE